MRSMIMILVLVAIAHESATKVIPAYSSDTPATLPLVKSCFDGCFHDYQLSLVTTMPFRSLSRRICDNTCSVKFCEHSKMISKSPKFGIIEKCTILCDMEKSLHSQQVPCTSKNPGKPTHHNFVPLDKDKAENGTFSLPQSNHHGDKYDKKKEKENEKKKPNKNTPAAPLKNPQKSPPEVQAICSQLCKQGNGGKLCKCDLTPF